MRYLVVVLIFVSSMFGFGINNSKANPSETISLLAYSPQVCQFSLSKYTGTISSGCTQSFTVGLSCPQEADTYATVVVFIDGKHIASDVVKIPAGETRSRSVQINVGSSYDNQTYELVVQ